LFWELGFRCLALHDHALNSPEHGDASSVDFSILLQGGVQSGALDQAAIKVAALDER